MEILFIRHGECYSSSDTLYTEKKYPDPELTPEGRLQAEALGKRLAADPPDAVYASDLRRVRETAALIDRFVRRGVIIRAELREIDMGELHVSSWDSLAEKYPGFYEQWKTHTEDLPYPGGESGADVNRRMLVLMEEIFRRRYRKVAMVSHTYTITSCICALLDIPPERRFFLGSPLENTSISCVYYDGEHGKSHLRTLNDSFHLRPEWFQITTERAPGVSAVVIQKAFRIRSFLLTQRADEALIFTID